MRGIPADTFGFEDGLRGIPADEFEEVAVVRSSTLSGLLPFLLYTLGNSFNTTLICSRTSLL